MSEHISQQEDQSGNEVHKKEVSIPDELKPLLEDLPEAQAKAIKAVLVGMSIQRHTFKSPIPPPAILKGYNEVIPNGAERILSMSEKQSDHRMRMEKEVTAIEQKQSGRGQHYGLIVALSFLIASFILILMGHDVSGTIIGSIDLVALVTVFVVGKHYQNKSLTDK